MKIAILFAILLLSVTLVSGFEIDTASYSVNNTATGTAGSMIDTSSYAARFTFEPFYPGAIGSTNLFNLHAGYFPQMSIVQVTPPVVRHTGGGTDTTAPRLGFKKDCFVDVNPMIVSINDNALIVNVTYYNRELFMFEPSVSVLNSSDEDILILPALSLDSADYQVQKSFSVQLNNKPFMSYPVTETATLNLSSAYCNDILIPVSIDLVNKETVDAILGNPRTVDNVLKQSINKQSIFLIGGILFVGYLLLRKPKKTNAGRLNWRK